MMTNFFDIEGNIREDNDPEYGKQSTSKFFVLMSTQFFRTFNGCVLCRMRGSLHYCVTPIPLLLSLTLQNSSASDPSGLTFTGMAMV